MTKHVDLAALRVQVCDQARAISHLAAQISKLYGELVSVYSCINSREFLEMVGTDSAKRMELLGEMLNNMDAVDSEEDTWTDPIFERAHEIFLSVESASETQEARR